METIKRVENSIGLTLGTITDRFPGLFALLITLVIVFGIAG